MRDEREGGGVVYHISIYLFVRSAASGVGSHMKSLFYFYFLDLVLELDSGWEWDMLFSLFGFLPICSCCFFNNYVSFLFNLQFTFFVFVFSGSESCGIMGMRGRQTCLMCAHVFALCDICMCMGPAMRFAPTYASHQNEHCICVRFIFPCFALFCLI